VRATSAAHELTPVAAIVIMGMAVGMLAALAASAIARILDAAIARLGPKRPQYIMYQ